MDEVPHGGPVSRCTVCTWLVCSEHMASHLRRAHNRDIDGKPLPPKDGDKGGGPPAAENGDTYAANGGAAPRGGPPGGGPHTRQVKPSGSPEAEACSLPDLYPEEASPKGSPPAAWPHHLAGAKTPPAAIGGARREAMVGRGTKRPRADGGGEPPDKDPRGSENGEAGSHTGIFQAAWEEVSPRRRSPRLTENPLAGGKPLHDNDLNKIWASSTSANPARGQGIVNGGAMAKTGTSKKTGVGLLGRPDRAEAGTQTQPYGSATAFSTPPSKGQLTTTHVNLNKNRASFESAISASEQRIVREAAREKSAEAATARGVHVDRGVEGNTGTAALPSTLAHLVFVLTNQELSDEGSLAGDPMELSEERAPVDIPERRRNAKKKTSKSRGVRVFKCVTSVRKRGRVVSPT